MGEEDRSVKFMLMALFFSALFLPVMGLFLALPGQEVFSADWMVSVLFGEGFLPLYQHLSIFFGLRWVPQHFSLRFGLAIGLTVPRARYTFCVRSDTAAMSSSIGTE